MELRKSRRFRLSVPASFEWEHPEGVPQKGTGTTRDVALSGVFICAEASPLPGARLQVDICFPPLNRTSTPVRVHADGKVVRVENKNEGDGGFAAEVVFREP